MKKDHAIRSAVRHSLVDSIYLCSREGVILHFQQLERRLLGEEGEQGAHALLGILKPLYLFTDCDERQLVALGVGEGLKELHAI